MNTEDILRIIGPTPIQPNDYLQFTDEMGSLYTVNRLDVINIEDVSNTSDLKLFQITFNHNDEVKVVDATDGPYLSYISPIDY